MGQNYFKITGMAPVLISVREEKTCSILIHLILLPTGTNSGFKLSITLKEAKMSVLWYVFFLLQMDRSSSFIQNRP